MAPWDTRDFRRWTYSDLQSIYREVPEFFSRFSQIAYYAGVLDDREAQATMDYVGQSFGGGREFGNVLVRIAQENGQAVTRNGLEPLQGN